MKKVGAGLLLVALLCIVAAQYNEKEVLVAKISQHKEIIAWQETRLQVLRSKVAAKPIVEPLPIECMQ